MVCTEPELLTAGPGFSPQSGRIVCVNMHAFFLTILHCSKEDRCERGKIWKNVVEWCVSVYEGDMAVWLNDLCVCVCV